MAREIERLDEITIRNAKERGLYADGDGLYLQVSSSGSKSWVFRFTMHGRTRDMGLGKVRDIGLALAREKARACRQQRLEGIDPIESRKAKRAEAKIAAAKSMTFDQCTAAYISAHGVGWRNPKHAAQWKSTLATYVSPVMGKLPVQAVDVGLITKVLEPIWTTKPETASRIRGRIECVLDWAAARRLRRGDNPARWKGHLDKLLAPRSKVRTVKHHAALPYSEMGAFLAAVREREGTAASALEFVILTAARSGEVLGARWDEIDLKAQTWTVPGSRMKAGREHRVPLTRAALAIIERMQKVRQNEFVFPGDRAGKPLSSMALLMLLRRMNQGDLTAHGFRSTFRDWCAERTNYPREVCEMALAHAIGDKVEAAYRRGDLFEKRRRLMDEWAKFCAKAPPATAKVLAMHGQRS